MLETVYPQRFLHLTVLFCAFIHFFQIDSRLFEALKIHFYNCIGMEYCRNLCNDAVAENENGWIFWTIYRWDGNVDSSFFLKYLRQGANNLLELIVLSIEIFWAFANLFGICELGQRFSGECEEICDVLNQLRWYWFSCDTQRMLITILLTAQKPIEIEIFGSISCNRNTFKEVSFQ